MSTGEGPRSSPAGVREQASEAGQVDMDFIKSFLSKTDDEQADSKSGSLAEGEELEQTGEKQNTEDQITEDKPEKKKKKGKRKVVKKTVHGKPPPAPKQDNQVSEDEDEQKESKPEQKQVKPVPKPKKSVNRPPSAPRSRLNKLTRPASAPRQRSDEPSHPDSDEADSDLESIEQVERQNQNPSESVRRRNLKKSPQRLRMRPQSASKYESLKRADHLQDGTSNGYSESGYLMHDQNNTTRVRFHEKTTKDSENTELWRKKKFRHTGPQAFSSMSQTQYNYRDYHTIPLKYKYQELQDLYSKKFHESKVKDKENPEVVTYAKGMLRKYGVKVTDPVTNHADTSAYSGPRSVNRSVRAYRGLHGTEEKAAKSLSSDDRPVIVDMSEGEDLRRVKFEAGEGGSVCSTTSLDQDSEDIITVEREIALQSLHNKDRPLSGKQRGRKGKPTASGPRGKASRSKTPESAHSSLSRTNSTSPPRSGGRFWSTDTSGSESPSPVRGPTTEYDLRHSDNTTIKQWLKKKNREIRKKKREERKKMKQDMKEKDEEVREKEEKLEKSDKKVAAWMKLKKKETRLLHRKQKSTTVLQVTRSSDNLKFSGKVTVTEKVTDENRENMVADGKEKVDNDVSCQGAGKKTELGVKGRAISPKRPASAKSTKTSTVEVNMNGQEDTASCTCGYAEAQRLKEEELKQARLAARRRALEAKRARQAEKAKRELLKPRTASVSYTEDGKGDAKPTASEGLPDISKAQGFKGKKLTNKEDGKKDGKPGETLNPEEKPKKQPRQSYNDWLKKKQEEMKKKQQEERKQKEELAKSVDDETKDVMQKVARKRIDNILEGKKRIDTGIKQIDTAANASVEERIEAKKGGGKSKDRGNVSTPDLPDDGNAEAGGIFLTEKPSKPDSPRYVLPADDTDNPDAKGTKQRPSSARPASAKTTPKRSRPSSAKAHINRPSSRADKVTAKHSNPFKLPQPPPPRKHSPSPPRPKVKKTPAYNNVKYQQQSWEDFSEFVWDKVNQDVEEDYQKHERPEPMGADNPDDVIKKPSGSGLASTDGTKKEDTAEESNTQKRSTSSSPRKQVDDDDETRKDLAETGDNPGADNVPKVDEKEEKQTEVESSAAESYMNDKPDEELVPETGDDTYGDDFEQEDGGCLSVPSIQIKSPSPDIDEEAQQDVTKDTEQTPETTDDKEKAGGSKEEEPGFFEELHRKVDEEIRQKQAEISKKLKEEGEGLAQDEVDNGPSSVSAKESVEGLPNKEGQVKRQKSVHFSEEIQTQEFVYTEYEEDDYNDDNGNEPAGFGASNEEIQFDMALPLDAKEDAGEEVKDDTEEEVVPDVPSSGDDAVSFLMKNIMDSASQNVTNLRVKQE